MGVISTTQALTRAHEQGLDLIEVAPDARPPVCHIANLGKWQYEQAKKTRLERKEGKHRQSETKGVRITMRASTHDLAFRARQADGFLKEGHKVRLELAMYGREKAHKDFGKERITEFLDLLITPWRMEQEPARGGKGMETIIVKGKKQTQKPSNDISNDTQESKQDTNTKTQDTNNTTNTN
ncbi:MAG: translation initiation factor IF-3 [Candidatus Terrybacteria bacterium RIFCSPHIGHO2_01_FULL_48_17]|uniref:Translation initiation factor IF-3 n=1 Tax=Candidatus Terrybacteria bacterium RIFCSPHIGHO2_01_FULL_48_17 TaxID=1802362 RepID=A0A1G2PKR0_9BACT|nr:MAG: translation initiation factor IF-3 [Candidatus Terrybacteria bacterium RIFCSPHIGHO2_01_FULL_48_17]OHA53730.1 MAG: translation initiation factor IF-3 [Candidatus Terrybacteria bacterium RIFCSPLOWO2_01_FULL_48_14]